jgi:hypothetical protein
VQGTEPLPPELAVRSQPLVHLGESLRSKGVDAALRLLADLYQPCLSQHTQVPGDARAGDRESFRELTGSGGVISENLQHRSSARVREGLQHRIHEA